MLRTRKYVNLKESTNTLTLNAHIIKIIKNVFDSFFLRSYLPKGNDDPF